MSIQIYKILVIGASGVGKTSFLSNFAEYLYKESTKKDAIFKNVSYVLRNNENIGILGLDYLLKGFNFEVKKYRFHFWDLKGDNKLDTLANYHFKGASGALVVFDLSRLESFQIALECMKIIKKFKFPFGTIGTKADLVQPDKLKSKLNGNKKTKILNKGGSFFYNTFSSNDFEKSEEYRNKIKNSFEIFLGKIINQNYSKAFSVDLNLEILIALNIYKVLSLTEFAHYLNKSKSTISRRTSVLTKLGIIQASEIEFEKTPGSIKRKYYSICSDFKDISEYYDNKFSDPNKITDLIKIREESWRKMYILSLIHEKYCGSLRTLTQKMLEDPIPQKGIIETLVKSSVNLHFLSEKQHNKFQSLRSDFYSKLKKILEDSDSLTKEYVFADMILPSKTEIKSLIEP
ncbi:MAG: hypothetical protein EAX91_13080 [Candidatus Lokiarchaeota archaeon]|nr:hypothetical protein [Candidatus Lokiarchaeota archaeon]